MSDCKKQRSKSDPGFATARIWFLAACCLLALLVFCHGCSISGDNSYDGLPRLVVRNTTYAFGQMRPASTNLAVFRFTNKGSDTLRITDVKKCCGVIINLDKKELSPREQGILTVQYRAGQVAETFEKHISLVTNDPRNSVVQLTVTGEVTPTLTWQPARLQIAANTEDVVCPDITIKSLDEMPFSVKGIAVTGKCLVTKLDPDLKATEFTLKPTVDLAKLNALPTNYGSLRIALDHPDYKVLTLPFSITPPLQALPAQLLAFDARMGESMARTLQVQDNQVATDSNGSVQIESVSAKNGSRVELRRATPNSTGCELQLEIWPALGAENRSFVSDQLAIKLKDGRELTVPLRVFYQSPAMSTTAGAASGT